jgi:hypothetical protein
LGASKALKTYFQSLKDKSNKILKFKKGIIKRIVGEEGNYFQLLKEKYKLQNAEMNLRKNEILLEGSQDDVSNASDFIYETLSLTNDINAGTCGICMCKFENEYKLLICGHKFCQNCIVNKITIYNESFLTKYPIKCPLCPKEIGFRKFQLEDNNYSSCVTEFCSFFKIPETNVYDCSKCGKSFCVKCKKLPHLGEDCEDAKDKIVSEF